MSDEQVDKPKPVRRKAAAPALDSAQLARAEALKLSISTRAPADSPTSLCNKAAIFASFIETGTIQPS